MRTEQKNKKHSKRYAIFLFLHKIHPFHESLPTCFVRLCIYDARTRSFISSLLSLFLHRVKLLNEQFITIVVADHTKISDVDPSTELKTTLTGIHENVIQATTRKQLLMFFNCSFFLFPGDDACFVVAFIW